MALEPCEHRDPVVSVISVDIIRNSGSPGLSATPNNHTDCIQMLRLVSKAWQTFDKNLTNYRIAAVP